LFDRGSFELQKQNDLQNIRSDKSLQSHALEIISETASHNYAYSWSWMGLPIIQMPEDIVLIQELIWELEPDLIVETGVAWGGGLALYSSILELVGHGEVIGIDITIPSHNKEAIMKTKFSDRIILIEGSSTDLNVFNEVANRASKNAKVLVILDSNHSHDHVLAELKLWSPLVRKGSYIIVSDTIVEHIPTQKHRIRPWGHGNNPATALEAFLESNKRFSNKNSFSDRALLSFNPGGYLIATD